MHQDTLIQKSSAIYRKKKEILFSVENYAVTIIIGSPGSGKSSDLPLLLYESGWCSKMYQMCCVQPVKISVKKIAFSENKNIVYITDDCLLREILVDPLLRKYEVIIIDDFNKRTMYIDILIFLLRKIQRARHKLTKSFQISKEAPDLKLIININVDNYVNIIKNYFKNDKLSIIDLDRKLYPVDIFYLKNPIDSSSYLSLSVQTAFNLHVDNLLENKLESKDILVFLTGKAEIDAAIKQFHNIAYERNIENSKFKCFGLYSGVSSEEIEQVSSISGEEKERRIIFSTNIGSNLISIDGIKYVIDCGYFKEKYFNPEYQISLLKNMKISKSIAKERTICAGKNPNGKCFRLYTENEYENEFANLPTPEIQRCDPTQGILFLKAMGINNLVNIDYLSPPFSSNVGYGLEKLSANICGCLDKDGNITIPKGICIAEIPIDPVMSACIMNALIKDWDKKEFNCINEILLIVSLYSSIGKDEIFVDTFEDKRKFESSKELFTVGEGDFITYLNIMYGFITTGRQRKKWADSLCLSYKILVKATSLYNRIREFLMKKGLLKSVSLQHKSDDITIRKCFVSVLFFQAARLENGVCTLVGVAGNTTTTTATTTTTTTNNNNNNNNNTEAFIHPSSVLFKKDVTEWIIYASSSSSSTMHYHHQQHEKTFLQGITTVSREWLLEYSGGYYKETIKK